MSREHFRLTDEQRTRLDALEKIQHPVDWQRGELAALRLTCGPEDRDRVEALSRRWASIPKATP